FVSGPCVRGLRCAKPARRAPSRLLGFGGTRPASGRGRTKVQYSARTIPPRFKAGFARTREGVGFMQGRNAIDELREQGRMTWIDAEDGWVAAPEDVMDALVNDGFVECKRATTTSRRDLRPTGGV